MSVHSFASVHEKLNRADENIRNLNAEIDAFLGPASDRIILNPDRETAERFRDAHRKRKIPIRFSVLIGEALYNMRSALDHFVYQAILAAGNTPHKKAGFPVWFKDPARDPDEASRYERQVQGLSPRVRARIDGLQPHLSGDKAADDAIYIIHSLNNRDKHKALVVTIATIRTERRVTMPGTVKMVTLADATRQWVITGTPKAEVKMDVELSTHISFGKFGSFKNEPVVPTLSSLHKQAVIVVGRLVLDLELDGITPNHL